MGREFTDEVTALQKLSVLAPMLLVPAEAHLQEPGPPSEPLCQGSGDTDTARCTEPQGGGYSTSHRNKRGVIYLRQDSGKT